MLIIRALERLTRGDGKRKVMIFLPPGSAKSTYGSVLFPPWFLAQFPQASILAASHGTDLAERWGRRVRNLIEDQHAILGIDTNPENRSAGRWQLAPRLWANDRALDMGEYLAAGAGKAIAGYRGDLGIMDDLVSGREEAMSEDQRTKLWEWYVFDFRPRLKPGARQVLIMTRWHEDDIAGRILAEEGDEWDVISVPMISESLDDPLGRPIGERLWKDWFTEKMVSDAMRNPSAWLSLYQQRPTTEDGTYWKREWFHPVAPKQVPPRSTMRVYGGSDYAVSADRGDYTVHAVVGLDPSDRPWLLDLWRERTTSDVWVDAWCSIVKFFRPLTWAEEGGQINSGVGPFLVRESHKRKAYTERKQFTPGGKGDKGVRAQSMRSHIATHGLWYASDLPGASEMLAELMSFPAGKHDDIHDALGLIGQLLDEAIHGRNPKAPSPSKASGYKSTASSAKPESWKIR